MSFKPTLVCISALSASVLLNAASNADSIIFGYEFRPLYTTVDDPANHVVPRGGRLDGVADLIINTTAGFFRCSGSLLPSGRHVLSNAHCFTNSVGIPITNSVAVTFERDSGNTTTKIVFAAEKSQLTLVDRMRILREQTETKSEHP